MSRRWLPFVKAGASLCLLVWLASQMDMARLADLMLRVPAGDLVLAVLALLLQFVLMAHRWHRIVTMLGGDLPWRLALHWVFVGQLLSMLLPTSVGGDSYRIWRLHQLRSADGLAFGSVVIERLSGLAIVGILVSACAAVMPVPLPPLLQTSLVALGPLLLAGLALLAVGGAVPAGRWPWLEPLRRFSDLLRVLLTSPPHLLETAAWGFAGSLCGFAAAWFIARGLGLHLDFASLVAVAGGAALLAVLPISVGGWGVREAGMVGLFGMLAVAAEPALALSLLWAALPVLLALVGAAALALVPGTLERA